MFHIHSLNVAHRDLKPENLLIKDKSEVRIKYTNVLFATISIFITYNKCTVHNSNLQENSSGYRMFELLWYLYENVSVNVQR